MKHCRETIKTKKGKRTYARYKKIMVEQTITMITKWLKQLPNIFELFAYTDFVKPKIKRFAFPFGPDEGNAIQYFSNKEKVHIKMKLPTCTKPRSRKDWEWIEQELTTPTKIRAKIELALSLQPKNPTLRNQKLKGGLTHFFLQFPWEYPKTRKKEENGQVLAVDLGLKKVATIVIFENGKQISHPITIKLKGSQYRHVERIYNQIVGIQKQLAKEKKGKQTKRSKNKRRGKKKALPKEKSSGRGIST